MREAALLIEQGELSARGTEEVNNHVHTIYSFSPYSPAMAAYKAWAAGLKAVGIMDHDSIAGAEEILESCKYIGLGSTAGFELRTSFAKTKLAGKRINSPDSLGIGYIAIHGIPRNEIPRVGNFLEPLQQERNNRNIRIIDNLNSLLGSFGIEPMDFMADVFPISQAAEGGTVTERHILYALGLRLVGSAGRGASLVEFLKDKLSVEVPGKIAGYLGDPENPHYLYDLLGLLKSSFLPKVFEQPSDRECIPVGKVVEFAKSIGALPAYAYLGDVTESPTGDKKAQKFEDEYIDELFDTIKEIGFQAVTYMPPRNTREQLKRVQKMCSDYELMEISGVDINSSRQSFSCPIILEDDFVHLADATWALIAHEKLSVENKELGLFHPGNPYAALSLKERIEKYNSVGRNADHHHPEEMINQI